jgi:hypothetical protein
MNAGLAKPIPRYLVYSPQVLDLHQNFFAVRDSPNSQGGHVYRMRNPAYCIAQWISC